MLFVVLVYLLTTKEGIIFSRQVNVSTILYNSSLDNMTKMNMIEQTDVSDPEYTSIIDKNTFCTGVSPYPSVSSNGGQDCANGRVEALKEKYNIPSGAYDTNVTVYSILFDNTLVNDTKVSLLKKIPMNETNSDALTAKVTSYVEEHATCLESGGRQCSVNFVTNLKNVYNPP